MRFLKQLTSLRMKLFNNICESFFPSVKKSLLFVFAGLKSVVRQREGHRRVIVLLGVFNFMCYIFTYNGTEGTHRYYYAQADT